MRILLFILAAVPVFLSGCARVKIVPLAPKAEVVADASFETATNGVYAAGDVLAGWVVLSNEVGLITDPKSAPHGSNYVALTSGRIAKTFSTKRGVVYQLQFHGKGPGLTDWWPGDGNGNDIIGAHPGTLHHMAFVDGKVRQAFVFNGKDSEVDFGTDVGNFGTSDFTIDFWIKQPRTAVNVYGVLEKRPGCNADINTWDIRMGPVNWPLYPKAGQFARGRSGHDGAFLTRFVADRAVHDGMFHSTILVQNRFPAPAQFPNPGQLNLEISGDNGALLSHFVAHKTVNDGVFHHAAFVRHGPTNSIYIDGVLDNSTHLIYGNGFDPLTGKIATDVANIHNDAMFRAGQNTCVGVDGTRPFEGELDELDLFNRALSPAEIHAIYKAGSLGKQSPISVLPNFQLTVDGIATNDIILTNASGGWQLFTHSFTAQKARTTIEFSGHALGVLFDDIDLIQQPPDSKRGR